MASCTVDACTIKQGLGVSTVALWVRPPLGTLMSEWPFVSWLLCFPANVLLMLPGRQRTLAQACGRPGGSRLRCGPALVDVSISGVNH